MSTVKRGTLAQAPERWKHLRPFLKRKTAKRERQAGRKLIWQQPPEPTSWHAHEQRQPDQSPPPGFATGGG